VERLRPKENGVGDQAAVESRQLAAVGDGQGEQIAVGDLAGVEQAGEVDFLAVEEADVVRPEMVAGVLCES